MERQVGRRQTVCPLGNNIAAVAIVFCGPSLSGIWAVMPAQAESATSVCCFDAVNASACDASSSCHDSVMFVFVDGQGGAAKSTASSLACCSYCWRIACRSTKCAASVFAFGVCVQSLLEPARYSEYCCPFVGMVVHAILAHFMLKGPQCCLVACMSCAGT